MRVLPAIICLGPLLWMSQVNAMTIAHNGVSDCVIVVAADAPAPDATAAKELQTFLQQVTGAELPIQHEDEVSETSPQIVVGPGARARRLVPDVNFDKLGDDGIVIRTTGNKLILAGKPPRGTLYAVYTFLEDVVGCRWWTSTESTIPRKTTLDVPALNTVYAPELISREAFYKDAFNSPFAVRLKLNGNFMQIPPEFGGHIPIIGWCHTFFQIMPPAKYFAEHPDWYSEIDGKRSGDHTQLCLTNEEMRKEFVRNVLARLRTEHDPRIISVTQNDWNGRCECAKCKALEEQEGSPSGPLIHFVNAVAADVEKEFPHVLVETLAYHYTRQAPLHVKPRQNVVIRLCSIECSYSQPLGTGPQNESFQHDMEQWSAIAPHLYVWNYVTNFANFLLPQPNMRSLAADIRYFIAHKTLGLFEQGDAYSTTGDFIRLRTWVLAHLMWNPAQSEDALIKEFMTGYYGAAAPYLIEYRHLLQDAVAKSDCYLRCSMTDTSGWLTIDVLDKATRLFDQAQAAVANDPQFATRVRRERLPLDLVWLNRYNSLQRAAQRQQVAFLGPEDPTAACKAWIAAERSFGNKFYGEGRPFDAFAENVSRRFRPPAPPPDFCKGLPKDDWIDVQDNFFRLYNVGTWVNYVKDAKASDGMAVRMPATHTQWAVQYPIPEDIAAGPWHCYVFARCDAKAGTGQAMQIGIYDTAAKKSIAQHPATIKESAGDTYKRFDLGVHELKPTMYFWVAPCGNPQEVDAVYVDRIVLVREKQVKK